MRCKCSKYIVHKIQAMSVCRLSIIETTAATRHTNYTSTADAPRWQAPQRYSDYMCIVYSIKK